ncbi:MAG: inositol monophosphatase family protein [Candidatus Nanopelagicales bacterium]
MPSTESASDAVAGLPPSLLDPRLTDPPGLLALAWGTARSAGQMLLAGRFDALAVDTKTTATDVVTQMDIGAEKLITEALLAARPDDGLLGEEGASRAGTSGVRWVIDPLDGTVNYTYGLPNWAVSIAAEVAGETVVGVVDVPVLAETYVGVRGGGAWLCDGRGTHRLRVNTPAELGSVLVATGFGYASRRRAGQGRVVAEVLPRIRDIRRAGAAAVDICWLAAGRVDAYYERGLNPWDHAAAGLLAVEAGAVFGGPAGRPASSELAWGIHPGLAGQFATMLWDLAADSD